jgi:ribosomal-protein-alanine N-acetyltransferase
MLARPAVFLRTAEPSDGAFITELSREAFTEYSRSAPLDTARMASRAHTLVATENDRPVGFAIVEMGREKAHLSAIAVHPSARGTGVGRTLLRAAESFARDRGARELNLATADSNLAALELFLRTGYLKRARHARYYTRGQHALEMYKPL